MVIRIIETAVFMVAIAAVAMAGAGLLSHFGEALR